LFIGLFKLNKNNRSDLQNTDYCWTTEGILIADDDKYSHLLLEKVFQKTGAEIFHAYTGNETIEIIKNHYREINIAIIDIIMPEPDGLEIVEKFHAEYPDIIYIAYTADILRLDVEQCIDAGFHKLFSKPMLPFKLLNEIDALLTIKAKL
jgi:CheY-like chemotaxis protein